MVSAKAMWWNEPETCPSDDHGRLCACEVGGWVRPGDVMLCGEINGWLYISDRWVLLPVSRLGHLPVGYGTLFGLRPLGQQNLDGFAEVMARHVSSAPSDEVFLEYLLDPIEQAGLLVRPLAQTRAIHAVCDPDLSVVGLLQPLKRGLDHGDVDRRAAV